MTRRARALTLYVSLAYLGTWLVWLPYWVAAVSDASAPGAFLYYAAAFGPFVAAVVAESYERGLRGVRDLLGRLLDVRRAPGWVVVGVLSPLLLVPLAAIPVWMGTSAWPDWSQVGVTDRAPGLGPAMTWVLMVASYGVGEEVGWRGFLLPRLQAGRSALAATLLLVPIWAAWHLPTFWFREGYVGLGLVGTVGFLIGLAAGAVVLTALYNSSRGSILAVALWHGTWNWLAGDLRRVPGAVGRGHERGHHGGGGSSDLAAGSPESGTGGGPVPSGGTAAGGEITGVNERRPEVPDGGSDGGVAGRRESSPRERVARAARKARRRYNRIADVYDAFEGVMEGLAYQRWRRIAWNHVEGEPIAESHRRGRDGCEHRPGPGGERPPHGIRAGGDLELRTGGILKLIVARSPDG